MTVVDAGTATIVFTDRSDGDLSVDGDPARLNAARRLVVDRPWTWLQQVHGATVVRVDGAGHRAGEKADGAVTSSEGARGSSSTARQRESSAPMTSNEGFSVVAPTSRTSPRST